MSARPIGYSYVRFSSKKQRGGDSLRRQTEDTVAGESPASWCARHNAIFDTALNYRDLGVSAFRGRNAKQGELKAFLDAIKSGRIRPGSYLLVERLDRISRQGVDEGMEVIKKILRAGVSIVTLANGRVFGPDAVKGLMKGLLELQILLEQAQQYSEALSKRVGAAWEKKRKKARDGVAIMSKALPGWLRLEGGKPTVIPERAAVVRRIFDLAISGYGLAGIVKKLTGDGVPAMGRTPTWNKTYILSVLTDRHALGEFQPRTRVQVHGEDGEVKEGRQADGEPIRDYFPAVVDEQTFHRAAASLADRKRKVGRPAADRVNVFGGLLKNAREGDSYIVAVRMDGRKRRVPVLLPAGASQGRSAGVSFPLLSFEKAILACLREIDPREILPPDGTADEVLTLSAELTAREGRIARLEAELLEGDSPALVRTIRTLEKQKAEVAAKLSQARQKAASPASEAWGECKSLLSALESAPDPEDARVRLRAVLSRVVDSIWILATGRGLRRYAAVQVNFKDSDACRRYMIRHLPPYSDGTHSRPGLWWAFSFTPETFPESLPPGHSMPPIDLRTCGAEIAEHFAADLPDVIDAGVEASMRARQAVEATRGVVRTDEETDEALRELDAQTPWGVITTD